MASKPTNFPNGVNAGSLSVNGNALPIDSNGNVVPGEATTTERGGVLLQPNIADLAAAPTEADFNGLLATLRAAGILSST